MSTLENTKVFKWANFVQLWALPTSCVLCGKRGQLALDLCADCQASLPLILSPCHGCGLPLPPAALGHNCGRCLTGNNRVTQTVAAFAYAEPVSKLIGEFKYQRKLQMGRVLAELLATTVAQRYRPEAFPDLLIPIPLHEGRLCQRGYNQAQLIAKDLGNSLQIPVAHQLVIRTQATPTQQGLRARERKRNLRGAFATTPGWQTTNCLRVALVDDVVTTMSTVREVTKVLCRDNPLPPEVHVWCLARA